MAKNKPKKEEKINVYELHNLIWELIQRCDSTEFEILGCLSKVEKEFERVCEEIWSEENRTPDEETEEPEEISTQGIPEGVGARKFDMMYR